MCSIYHKAMDDTAIHAQSRQNCRVERDRLLRETLRMRAFPKTAARGDHHVIGPIFCLVAFAVFLNYLSARLLLLRRGKLNS